MKHGGFRRRRMPLHPFLVLCALVAGLGLLMLALRPLDPPIRVEIPREFEVGDSNSSSLDSGGVTVASEHLGSSGVRSCATVEEMGKDSGRSVWKESLRIRRIIENHFVVNGASRVRDLPPEQFCSHGFVLGKTSEAGFGNEMYKVLTAAALSVMLNRSLIIGQTRHIEADILLGSTSLIPTLRLQ
ncbi:hypothetical protein L6164_004926 [Bauhinia variegata]|uniref:Uncharacterized protein n=1 Tax=Bauhinia variegata TaxID=167791 RepID=A0ACB9PNT6_BAUVA|nr:hypothetical protein L6164_004926 [Bauhinia variegata]